MEKVCFTSCAGVEAEYTTQKFESNYFVPHKTRGCDQIISPKIWGFFDFNHNSADLCCREDIVCKLHSVFASCYRSSF